MNIEAELSDIFPGASEMARTMRAHDWASTPLGDPRAWPEGLKVPLRMLLTSRFEMWLGWGPELRFFYNDAYIPTLGIKHPAMLGKPFQEVWSEVYADVADQVEKVRAGEATWNNAMLLLLERSGYPEETYHSFSYSPLYDSDGGVGGMLCVVSEETERVISERRLEMLRMLGSGLVGAEDDAGVRKAVCAVLEANRRDFPFALYLSADGQTENYSCTSDACDLLSDVEAWAPAPTAGVEIFNLDPARDWPVGAWTAPPTKALIVPILRAADNRPLGRLLLGLSPYRRDDQDIAGFARLIAGQISGALASVEALQRERHRADQLWSRSRDLMVVVDQDRVFRAVSPSWTRILGHPTSEVVGRRFDDFMIPDDLEPSMRALEHALSEGDLTGYENRFLTATGEDRCISWHTVMEDGLVFAYGRDVTEQKAATAALATAETALRQAQKMEAVGQLTGGIAHDFNNLLTGIIGSLDVVKRRIAAGRFDDIARFMDAATASADRAAGLTQRLLAFSRRQTLDPVVVDPRALVEGMVELIDRSIGELVVVDYAFDPAGWRITCDPHQLESAILNLALNARDAMPEGGRLTITTATSTVRRRQKGDDLSAAPGDYVVVTVRDTGTGMSQDTAARVFEPFFTTKRQGEGTGLGLSMVYGFARQSHGFVRIESELGVGTAVSLHLPRTEALVSEPSESKAVMIHGRTIDGTVLVVEDEPAVRMLMIEALESLGLETLEAEDGVAGLAILRSDRTVDLVVTDVGLPGLNGRQMIDAARTSRPELRALFVTGYAYDAMSGETVLESGSDVLTKPLTGQMLAQRVSEILAAGSKTLPSSD
ncbi:PAS domain-containing protein [Brevundimonas diminuta]|uniref:PAS domain-containing protein n=1 Tax=Brevundimonas diminuta TaxID=293 RepID=UPI003D9A35D7